MIKRLALIAHDNCKKDLIDWVEFNYFTLLQHNLFCTGTTGALVEKAIINKVQKFNPDFKYLPNIVKYKSGPLGGDFSIGNQIVEGNIDIVIFFWDGMSAHPHDVDIKAVQRICQVYNIPIAPNRATADMIISSVLFESNYERKINDYSNYIDRLK